MSKINALLRVLNQQVKRWFYLWTALT